MNCSKSSVRAVFVSALLLVLMSSLFPNFSTYANVVPAPAYAGNGSAANPYIGYRTEKPGAFLRWPLSAQYTPGDISRLPHSKWTLNFLGITFCPLYPANLSQNPDVVLPGVPDQRVKWNNTDDRMACYTGFNTAQTLFFGHDGTDINAPSGAVVYSAAKGQVISIASDSTGYTVCLRHSNVNQTGQTWYTCYLHMSGYYSQTLGRNLVNGETINAGVAVGAVGSLFHLHFEVGMNSRGSANARNPWGIDTSPWDGCLWLNQSLCRGSQSSSLSYDYNRDGVPDIWAFDTQDAGTNSTAVHIISGADFQDRLISSGTWLHKVDHSTRFAIADYNRDGVPDIWAFDTQDKGTNSTAVHIISGANFQDRIISSGTWLHQVDQNTRFAVADYDGDGVPDIWAFDTQDKGTNSTAVHIISGANFQDRLISTGTWLHQVDQNTRFAVADYDGDGVPDIWAFDTQDMGTNSTAVHIISGANFQDRLISTGTWLGRVDYRTRFAVADYNGDGVPDIWAYDTQDVGTNSTAVHIISGANFQDRLISTGTWLHQVSYSTRFGDDRAPTLAAPVVASPPDGSPTTNSQPTLTWGMVPNAGIYQIQFNLDTPPLMSPMLSNINQFTLPKIYNSGLYFWRVRATNPAYVDSDWSSIRSLQVDVSAPLDAAPAMNYFMTDFPTLSWNRVSWAAWYELQVDNDVDFSSPAYSTDEILGTALTHTLPILPNATYYWRVRAYHLDGTQGTWSELGRFTLDVP
jgi:murein DD-endopeptidase MepM/ murein hydrolase activator NlpD